MHLSQSTPGEHLMVENEKEQGSKENQYDVNGLRMGRIGHWNWDLVTNAMVWSPGLYSIFQLDPYGAKAVSLMHFLEWLHPDDRPKARNLIWLAHDSRQLQEGRYRIVSATGMIRNVSLLAEPALDEAGQAVRIVMTIIELIETA
jgi:PAS domain-containing protein